MQRDVALRAANFRCINVMFCLTEREHFVFTIHATGQLARREESHF